MKTDRPLVIREARETDASEIAAIYTPIVRDTWISFDIEPPASRDIRSRLVAGRSFVPWRVATSGDSVTGFAYADRHRSRPAYRWTCETTVYVEPSRHRRGVGRELMADLLGDLVSRGFRTALAVIPVPNHVSVAFHESLGFTRIGTFSRAGFKAGAWRDTEWWTRELVPGTTRPDAPPRLGPLDVR